MEAWIPASLAVAAALLIAVGTVLRQRASAASGAITPGWWLGAGVALAGFVFQAWALGVGSILLVQPLVVLAVLFALPLEAWSDHRHPRPHEWAWGATLVTCVVVFLLVARPHNSVRKPDPLVASITLATLIVVLIVLVVLAERCDNAHHRALCYGLTAGALFGVSAVLIKALAYKVVHEKIGVLMHPGLYLLIIVLALAIVTQQRGFGAGDLQTSFPAMNVMEPAVAMVLGVVLLGQNLRVGVWTAIFLIAVLGIAVVAVIKLAKHAAIRGDRGRPHAEEPVDLAGIS